MTAGVRSVTGTGRAAGCFCADRLPGTSGHVKKNAILHGVSLIRIQLQAAK